VSTRGRSPKAVKGLIEAIGDEDLTEAGERFLDDLADEALAFAGKSSHETLSDGAGRAPFV